MLVVWKVACWGELTVDGLVDLKVVSKAEALGEQMVAYLAAC
jgi:hypothetical protein